jgi:peptide deformylase
LEDKFDQEKNCSGLAAPQIGISKRAIIFRVENDENLKKWRSNLEQFMPKTILINPLCTPIGEDTNDDYEGCFSVDNVAGLVTRANKISYSAMDIDGNTITGEAKGFLARVIQHEIDHLNGVLFIDLAKAENILDIEEYRRLRAAAINAENSNSNDAQS